MAFQRTLLAGAANVPLEEAVARSLGSPLGVLTRLTFPDGEIHVEIKESVHDGPQEVTYG